MFNIIRIQLPYNNLWLWLSREGRGSVREGKRCATCAVRNVDGLDYAHMHVHRVQEGRQGGGVCGMQRTPPPFHPSASAVNKTFIKILYTQHVPPPRTRTQHTPLLTLPMLPPRQQTEHTHFTQPPAAFVRVCVCVCVFSHVFGFCLRFKCSLKNHN